MKSNGNEKMSDKIFLDDAEDEITYKTTDFLDHAESRDEKKSKHKSGGLLIFFVSLSLIAILAAVYIYVTKNNEIKLLKIVKQKLESSSKVSDRNYQEKVADLENQLNSSKQTIDSLTSKNRDYNDQLSKTQTSLSKTEADRKSIQLNLDQLTQKIEDKEAQLKNREAELVKTKNERKLAEDDLKDAGERITRLDSEISTLKKDVSFWQKKYDKLNKEQTDAVNEILTSAQSRQQSIDMLEQELLKAYEKMELYYSLIGWEENFKLTNRIPLSKATQKPVLQTTSRPEYPQNAQKKKIEGMVILKGILSEEGKFTNIEVLYSPQRNTQLAEAAKAALGKYRYRPAQKDGSAVKVALVVPIDFQAEIK